MRTPKPEDLRDIPPVAVIGAGLAGLTCARVLQRAGIPVTVWESASQVGGKVATRQVRDSSGRLFLVDEGFQVLLSGYSVVSRWMDLKALELYPFPAGSWIRQNRGWVKLGDPIRQPRDLWPTLSCPALSLKDKLLMGTLRAVLLLGWTASKQQNWSTERFLRWFGFSSSALENFFRPFFGSVFLEKSLDTRAGKFIRLFHLFSSSQAAVPRQGMAQLARRLAQPLDGHIRLQCAVQAVRPVERSQDLSVGCYEVVTAQETTVCSRVVLAGQVVERLLGPLSDQGMSAPESPTAHTFYFVSHNWNGGRYLYLGGANSVVSSLAPLPHYSPPGTCLLAACVVLDWDNPAPPCVTAVAQELAEWFPSGQLEFLAAVAVPCPVPRETASLQKEARVAAGLYRCGDHCRTGSIEGAMESGEAAAHAILQDLFSRGFSDGGAPIYQQM